MGRFQSSALMQAIPAEDNLTVSVIVPVYNGGAAFRRCLEALATLSPRPFELIVVANGDTDGSGDAAASAGPTVIRVPTASGPALARNLGAHAARGSILFFVDADVVVPHDAVRRVIELFAQDPALDAVMGSYDDEPGDPGFLSQYRNLLHHYVHQQGREDASTFWGACGAIRRELFMARGGFSEAYRRPSIEDIELGYRLKESGARLRLCKSLQVKHLKRWTAWSMLRTDLFQRAIPWTLLIHSRRRAPNDLNLSVQGRLSTAAAMLLALGLVCGLWWTPAFLAAGIAAVTLAGVNRDFYRFCLRKRGVGFLCRVVPWHWLYFVYSGVGFALGTAWHILGACGESNWPGVRVTRVGAGR